MPRRLVRSRSSTPTTRFASAIGVSVIEGQVAYTFTSDKTKKENFQPVNAKDILRKLATLDVSSWNYIGHDANAFRHYGPMAQSSSPPSATMEPGRSGRRRRSIQAIRPAS